MKHRAGVHRHRGPIDSDVRTLLSSPPPQPYRAPVHELAIAARNGRALLGIAHAGEMLAGVRLNPERLLRHLEAVAAVARELGIDESAIANAVRITAPPGESVCPQTPANKTKRPTEATCRDCGAQLHHRAQKRCPDCRDVHNRQYAREYMRRRYAALRNREPVQQDRKEESGGEQTSATASRGPEMPTP